MHRDYRFDGLGLRVFFSSDKMYVYRESNPYYVFVDERGDRFYQYRGFTTAKGDKRCRSGISAGLLLNKFIFSKKC